MVSIKVLKAVAVIGVAAVVAGCATSKAISQAEMQAQYVRKVTLHTKESIQSAAHPERAFALIGMKEGSDQWELIRVSTRFPEMRTGQEVFRVSDDLKQWETVTPRLADCSKSSRSYSVCASTLTTKDWLGYANYDSEAVLKAVNSIPDEPAKAVMQSYLDAEDAAALSKYEEKREEQAACYASHDVGSREVEAAGGRAMAAAIAGKPLRPEEMAAIRRAQQRMSASSVCGFNIQPPKKRASAG
ncbi:hypothetical protein GL58_11025 [Comamonas testosteroni]|uniref:Lipoprotein n=1 Tax=Comamonas testosteroni TaxID=285 RepID=A0A0L7MEK2_COMTE|nr:hypothetical protein [Comamonas testosteroni]KOC20028.1 hypothetical protein GL58_11025 [Comamonas testosteroni]